MASKYHPTMIVFTGREKLVVARVVTTTGKRKAGLFTVTPEKIKQMRISFRNQKKSGLIKSYSIKEYKK